MSVCEHCGKEIGPESILGMCPECLIKIGLEDTGTVSAVPGRVEPPPLETLRDQFPQLEILELLGRGGMGAVYKARQPQLDRIVALKILLPDIGRDPAFAERFAIEARALARLNHPNILTIHDFGQVGGLFYFVMEYVDGLNLRELLDAERIAAREALAIVPQICDALQFAHDHGIVHRDIKPENILLDRLGRVKVADFGLAKLMGGSEAAPPPGSIAASFTLTEAGRVLGTPHYMAPEQMERPREVDHRADIYALGVVFYQMLTGELPGQTLEPPSRKVRLDVRLDEVVLRALEKLPELRYQQVSEVKTRVETIAETLGEGKESEIPPSVPKIPSPAPSQKIDWRSIIQATVWHVILLIVLKTVTLSIIPYYKDIYSGLGGGLPLATRLALRFYDFVNNFGFVLFPPLVTLDFLVCWAVQSVGGKKALRTWFWTGCAMLLLTAALTVFLNSLLLFKMFGRINTATDNGPLGNTGFPLVQFFFLGSLGLIGGCCYYLIRQHIYRARKPRPSSSTTPPQPELPETGTPPVFDERSVGTWESPEEHPNPPSNDFPSANPDRGDLPPSIGLFASLGVVATYAATVLYGFLCLLLSTRAWMGGAFVLAGCVSAPLVFLLKRFAGRETLRSVFKSGAWLAWGAALPTIGFALFFLCALVLEKGKWNPGAEEAFVVPLVWLGAVLLPACASRLWRAARTSPPADTTPPSIPAPPFRFSRLAIDGACLGLFCLVMFLFRLSGLYPSQTGSSLLTKGSDFIYSIPFQLGLAAPIAMTIVGWMAVSQIRRSAGRIYGMGLAVFEGLFLPLLALDAGIAYLFHELDRLIVNSSMAVISVVLTVVALGLIVLVNYRIVHRVWQAVNRPLRPSETDSSPSGRAPSPLPAPSGGWRPVVVSNAWHTFLLILILCFFVLKVPRYTAIYTEMGMEIPWLTRQVVNGSQFLIHYGLPLFLPLVALDFFLCWLAQNRGGRKGLWGWSIVYLFATASVTALTFWATTLPLRTIQRETTARASEPLSSPEQKYQQGIGPDVAFFQSETGPDLILLKGRALAGTRLAFYLGDNPENGWGCTLPNTTSRFSIKVEKRSNNTLDCRVLDEITQTEIFPKDSIKTMSEVNLSEGTLDFAYQGLIPATRPMGVYTNRLGEWTSSSGEKQPVFVSLIPPAAYVASPGNAGAALEEPAPDPALVEQKPELRFLVWRGQDSNRREGELDGAWHPDGSPVDVNSEDRKLLDEMGHGSIGDATDPGLYFLYLGLKHPLLDWDSTAEMQILDTTGQPFKLGPHSGAQVRPLTGGWVACILSEDNRAKWPSPVNLRLRYTLRPWKEEHTIPSNYNTSGNMMFSHLPHGVSVTSVGQDTEGDAFIAVTRDLTVDPDIQCGFVAITRDGRRRMCRSQFSSKEGNFLPEKLKVQTPISQIQEFRLLSRPFREAEFKDVILKPDPGKTQKPATTEAASTAEQASNESPADSLNGKQLPSIPRMVERVTPAESQSQPSPPPEILDEKPQLRFLARWLHPDDRSNPYPGRRGWLPNGEALNANSVEYKVWESGNWGGAFAGEEGWSLFLGWTHPLFEQQSCAEMQIRYKSGQLFEGNMGTTSVVVQKASALNGNTSWLFWSRTLPVDTPWPALADLRLRYAIGPWEEYLKVPVDQKGMRAFDNGVMFGSIGQNDQGNAFISLMFDLSKSQEKQYDLVALARDGQRRIGAERGIQKQGNIYQEIFTFQTPLTRIQEFRLLTRPIREVEFKDVVMQPTQPMLPAASDGAAGSSPTTSTVQTHNTAQTGAPAPDASN